MNTFLLGSVLFLGLVFGGRSPHGNPVDSVLLVYAIIASTCVLWRNALMPLPFTLPLKIATIALLLATLQLVPLPFNVITSQKAIPAELAMEIIRSNRWSTISLDPGRTLSVVAWLSGMVFYLFALSSQRRDGLLSLISWLIFAGTLNAVAASLQFSAEPGDGTSFPFVANSATGFFANPNHFCTLIFSTIPLLIVHFRQPRYFLPVLLSIGLATLCVVETGSRAGIIGLAVSVAVGFFIRYPRPHWASKVLAGSAIVTCVAIFFVVSQMGLRLPMDGVRLALSRHTFFAFLDNLPFGTGFGTFDQAYRQYEPVDEIRGYFINHAHNDYVELLLEGGIPALALLMIALLIIFRRIWAVRRSPIHCASALSIGLILTHSMVDYPLRTFGLSVLFCLLLAILFSELGNGSARTFRATE